MSVLLAKLIQTTAKTANAGLHGYAHKSSTSSRKRKRKKQPGCTPCEAMARREAARRIVHGNRG